MISASINGAQKRALQLVCLDPIPSIKHTADNYSPGRRSRLVASTRPTPCLALPSLCLERAGLVLSTRKPEKYYMTLVKPFPAPYKNMPRYPLRGWGRVSATDSASSHFLFSFFSKTRKLVVSALAIAPMAAPPWRVVFFSRIYARYSTVFIITSTRVYTRACICIYIYMYIFFFDSFPFSSFRQPIVFNRDAWRCARKT